MGLVDDATKLINNGTSKSQDKLPKDINCTIHISVDHCTNGRLEQAPFIARSAISLMKTNMLIIQSITFRSIRFIRLDDLNAGILSLVEELTD